MQIRARLAPAVMAALLLLIVGASFMPFRSPMRGWLLILGLAGSGMLFIGGAISIPRRSARAFCAYLICSAAMFGPPSLWSDLPARWDWTVMMTYVAVAMWYGISAVQEHRGTPSA